MTLASHNGITVATYEPASIVLVLAADPRSVEKQIRRAGAATKRDLGLNVRIELRSHAAFADGASADPPPLVGGVLVIGGSSHVATAARRWGVPVYQTPESGRELFMVARDWIEAFAPEINNGPRARAARIALSGAFRRFSLQAWEMLDEATQSALATRIGSGRRVVQLALLSDETFDRLRSRCDHVLLAAELGVWDPRGLRLVRPAAPTSLFVADELRALDEAAEIEDWSDADRAIALSLGVELKIQIRERRRDESSDRELTPMYLEPGAVLRTAPRWIALMESGDGREG